MNKNILLLFLLLLQIVAAARQSSFPGPDNNRLSFRENKGQITNQAGLVRSDVDFIMVAPDLTLSVGQGQLHYQFVKTEGNADMDSIFHKGKQIDFMQNKPETNIQDKAVKKLYHTPNLQVYRMDVILVHANKNAVVIRAEEQKEEYHYYKGGGNGTKEAIRVKTFGKITYKDIYPHIDWVLYAAGGKLKYDFIVHPGGKVSDIQLQYAGADSVLIVKDGNLEVKTPLGKITERAPYVYEQLSKKKIDARFVLQRNTAGFRTNSYEGTLVIDPGVDWATFFGNEGDETVSGMTCDSSGNVYITGTVTSQSGIVTSGAHQTVFGGLLDAYLSKFDSLGQLQWSTYFGGNGIDAGFSISCDRNGHVYLAGITTSANGISTPGSFQDSYSVIPGSFLPYNGFLIQFTRDGIRQWGTYYGASCRWTMLLSVACDIQGNVYVAGGTDSSTSSTGALVTAGAHQTVFGGGVQEAYRADGLLVKFDSSGNRLWATYYGGEHREAIQALICDDSGNVFISGFTYSSMNIASPNTFESMAAPASDGFLAKFNPDGVRQWGTFLHGRVSGLAFDPFTHLYVAGTAYNTHDSFIYTPGCHQAYSSSPYGGFLMSFNPQSGARNWGTYYSGESIVGDAVNSVSCDQAGKVYIGGITNSFGNFSAHDIATPESHQDTLNAPDTFTNVTLQNTPPPDCFVAQFDTNGIRKWATYYGGPSGEDGGIVSCDRTGALYLAGTTASNSAIATPGSFQSNSGGAYDAFIVRLLPVDIALTAVNNPVQDTVCAGQTPLSVQVKNQGRINKEDTLFISYHFSGPSIGNLDTFFIGGLASGASDVFSLGNPDFILPGTYNFTVYQHYTRDDNERDNDTLHYDLTVKNAPLADIDVYNIGSTFHFSNNNPELWDQYYWDFGDGTISTESDPVHEYLASDSYRVTLIITNICGSDTATFMVYGIGNENGIDQTALARLLAVYPNPAEQQLYLKASGDLKLLEYKVVNILGQSQLEGTLKQKTTVSLSWLAPGSYIIRIRTDKGWIHKQFQVVHP